MLSPTVPFDAVNPFIGDTTPNIMNMPMPHDVCLLYTSDAADE